VVVLVERKHVHTNNSVKECAAREGRKRRTTERRR
jgi:hypothetical protein